MSREAGTTRRSVRKPPIHPKGALRKSASRFAQAAVGDYLNRDWTAFFVHAGTALEHLAKAYLASIHPSLIADGRSFDSLLHACGRGGLAKIPRESMRTIGATAAVERCGLVLPAIANMRQDLDALVQARNGAVHMGEGSERQAEQSLVALFRASRHMLAEGGWDEATYWGNQSDFVKTQLSDSANEARLHVSQLAAKAKMEFEKRFGGHDAETRQALLSAIVATYSKQSDEEQFIYCPVCETEVLAEGALEIEWKPEWDRGDFGEPVVSGEYPEVTFYPGHMHCRACDLELDGEDEMHAAGVEESIELMDFDTRELYRERYMDDYA